MKRVIYAVCLTLIGFLSACNDNDTIREKVEYNINEPVFMSADEFRSLKIETKAPQEIKEQGNICFYEGYLYISEPGKGIHIIDNRNPSAPKAVGFVELEGNADIAVKNNILYADAYVDLVWFNISNPAKPEYINRLENVFKYALPIAENGAGIDYNMCYSQENSNKIVVGWKLQKRVEYYERPKGEYYYDSVSSGNSSGGSSTGANGSMARFGFYKDYLYTVMNNTMSILDISGAAPIKACEDIYVGMDVETIFSYKDYMFMGTPTGMMIYSVENPIAPERMSTIWHALGCDPVIVEDDIAYITIHAGNLCGQSNNELIVYDVSNVKDPRHIVSYGMTKPKGLGIDNGTLFVCDDGLKVFNAKEPQKLMANQLAHYSGMDGYDLIPHNNILMMIAEDGLYQYNYTDVNKISQLSKIAIKK